VTDFWLGLIVGFVLATLVFAAWYNARRH